MADTGRVFWLGMHKVLKLTELARLRTLGFETFNPAYISPVFDQSADRRIDHDQPTTLPSDVFARLISYDFFYRPIDVEIGELLNAHFDTVIVTINFLWLKELLKVFRGKVIYRVYGQHFQLSDKMIEVDIWRQVAERPDLYIVPFAAESIENEHRWFVDRVAAVVPYQIPDDVFDHSRAAKTSTIGQIATIFPNIQNEYFGDAYRRFAGRFHESYFSILGPQRSHPDDIRIVNALPRREYLDTLGSSAGFYYDYRDSVCYLPPIEAMQLGVPVVCARGSLLAQFLGRDTPNVVADDYAARDRLEALLAGDATLAAELIAAQEPTRQRYDRVLVQPAFDAAMRAIIAVPPESPSERIAEITTSRSKIVVPLHVDGLFRHSHGKAYAFEGIPRVVDVVIDTLVERSDCICVVTCTAASQPIVYDFFLEKIRAGRLQLEVIDEPDRQHPIDLLGARLAYVDLLGGRDDVSTIFVPHYYLFPEFLLTDKRTVLYLPDYFPHLSPGVVFDVSARKDALNKEVGVAHARHADIVLTNSDFTRNYLADAGFITPGKEAKVVVAPLPFLGARRAEPLAPDELDLLEREVGGRPFLFYPTANRPNKRLDVLMDVFAELRRSYHDLALVLTGSLHTHLPALERAQALGLVDQITFIHHAGEGVMRWLYTHCRALCLTSVLEGNFPPQVLEALNYGAPVVATRLPTIVEILGERAEELLLCRRGDSGDFVDKVKIAITDREQVLRRQEDIAEQLHRWNSRDAFARQLAGAFPEMLSVEGRLPCA